MTTRQTSINAFRQIEADGLLSRRRFEVYEMLYQYGPMTLSQLTNAAYKKLGHAFNSGNFGTRLSELRSVGVAQELGTTKCPITGREVILWDVTDALPARDQASKRLKLVEQIAKTRAKLLLLEKRLERMK
ncbi:MAG: hypothetical protein HC902_07595 [Calothrix sp. SM1_5_4]|nr:hypothetical protein [Calothrix sp. SM1_5_4]